MLLKANQKLPLSIEIKDKFGNAAAVDGAPVWSLTDPALGALTASEDGMSAEFVPAGAVGSARVQCQVDADLGEGVKPILGELEITVLPAEAATVSISAGTPVES